MSEAEIALVLEILDQAFQRGRRAAFAEAAELADSRAELAEEAAYLGPIGKLAVREACGELATEFRRLADPKPGVVGDE